MRIEILSLGLQLDVELPEGCELVYIRDWNPTTRKLDDSYDYVYTEDAGLYLIHYRGDKDCPPTCSNLSIGFKWCDPGSSVNKLVRIG